MTIKGTESVDTHTFTGPTRTYLFRPAAPGRYPGLLLFSEILQVTGPVRRAHARQQPGSDRRDHGRATDDLGRQDPPIPREGRALIYNSPSDAGAHFQWHEFNAAHVFLRDEGPRYDPTAARICYDMVLELAHTHIG